MAVEPLFVADKDTLKSRLRLSGAAQTDALAQIDQAIEDVRVGFYDDAQGLGVSRVTALLAISYEENATTAEALLRTRANNLEVSWVRLLLMRRLPTLFMDASGNSLDVWNEEPLTRKAGRSLRDEIARLELEVAEGLAYLGAGDDDDVGDLGVVVFEPSTTPDRPGLSISPNYLGSDSPFRGTD